MKLHQKEEKKTFPPNFRAVWFHFFGNSYTTITNAVNHLTSKQDAMLKYRRNISANTTFSLSSFLSRFLNAYEQKETFFILRPNKKMFSLSRLPFSVTNWTQLERVSSNSLLGLDGADTLCKITTKEKEKKKALNSSLPTWFGEFNFHVVVDLCVQWHVNTNEGESWVTSRLVNHRQRAIV